MVLNEFSLFLDNAVGIPGSSRYIGIVIVILLGNWWMNNNNTSNKDNERKQYAPFPSSIASDVTAVIDKEVEKETTNSNYLQMSTRKIISKLNREELILGILIGKGSFCEIRLVETIQQKQQQQKQQPSSGVTSKKFPVVIKHLCPTLLKDKEEFQKSAVELILEAKYLSTFDHPNIISLRGVSQDGAKSYLDGYHDSFFFVMDRIQYTLFDRLKQWNTTTTNEVKHDTVITLKERLQIIADLAGAMEYLHKRNLVYRDSKPSNIGFDYKGNVKLIDFGLLAEIPKDPGYLIRRTGTLRYMAPECCLGKYDCKADVYSVTAILWELLSLREYLGNLSSLDHVKTILRGDRETLLEEEWSADVCAIIKEGWDGNPNQRLNMHTLHKKIMNQIQNMNDNEDDNIENDKNAE